MTTTSEGNINCPVQDDSQAGLIPLKTTLETKSITKVLSVYITSVPVKKASSTLDLIRKLIPKDGGFDLQHLRRFAKIHVVPEHARNSYSAISADANSPDQILLILAAASIVSRQYLVESLAKILETVSICSIEVPLLAPTSQEQATLWTTQFWPTVYKKSNPFGPHPSIVSRAEEEISQDVEKWFGLATEAARNAKAAGTGEAVGVVIVERRNGKARPVAIAADARWLDWPCQGSGNVTAHAALRAIAMVAIELNRDQDGEYVPRPTNIDIFRDRPVALIEKQYTEAPLNGDGYLCHDLEIYCTHEPCVMCSMAIVHSRFGRVIFEHQMPSTGGICASGELGHGLFWRKELNWTMLAWQWRRSMASRFPHGEDGTNETERSTLPVPNSDLNA